MQNRSATRELHHIGVLVEDIAKAAAALATSIGAGPFFELPQAAIDPATTRLYGNPEPEWTHLVALGFSGTTLMELTSVSSISDGPVGRALTRSPLNHLAFATDDWSAAMDDLIVSGSEPLFSVHNPQLTAGYLVHPTLGTIELIRQTEGLTSLVDGIRAASVSWDGSSPHRLWAPDTTPS